MTDFAGGIVVATGVYFALLLVIGWLSRRARRETTLSDFYLAGRSIGLVVLLLTLFATQYSGNSLSGFPGQTYREGLSYYMSVTFMVAIVSGYLLFAPRLFTLSRRHGFVTPGDFLRHRYRHPLLHHLGTTIFVLVLVNFLLAQLIAMGHAFAGLTAGRIPYAAGVVGGAVVILLYELMGGMRAVAWTDALQGIVLMLGLLIVAGLLVDVVGSPAAVLEQAAAVAPEKMAPPALETCSLWLSNFLLLGLGAPLYPQAIQRIFAARRLAELRRALAVMAFLPHVAISTVVFIGVVGIVLFPDLGALGADQVTFRVLAALREARPWTYGAILLVMMGVLAAIMSTADSCLLSLSSILTKDVAPGRRRAADAERLTHLGAFTSIGAMLVVVPLALRPPTTLWGLLVIKFELLIQLSPAFVLGTSRAREGRERYTDRDILLGLAVGIVVALGLYATGHATLGGLHAGTVGVAANYAAALLSARLGREGRGPSLSGATAVCYPGSNATVRAVEPQRHRRADRHRRPAEAGSESSPAVREPQASTKEVGMKHRTIALTLAAGLLVAAAGAPAAAWDPPLAVDINPDPDIVEINLTAAETSWQFIDGIDTVVYAYNGTIPGPTIEAEVGDTVIVHFANNLPETTTIHWHGVDTPATMDGSHISQLHIEPGATFTYEFPVHHARMMWYHPHVRTFDQVEKGLYGGLLVRDPAKDAALGWDGFEEHVVFFDDILLDSEFQIVPAFSFTDPLQNAIYHLNGREGNYLLVNGKEASEFTADVVNGKPQRWRFINAANTTFMRLGTGSLCQPTLPETCKLYEVGSDGGLLEAPRQRLKVVPFSCGFCGPEDDPELADYPKPLHPTVQLLAKTREGVFLLPGERMEILFTPIGEDGDTRRIWQHDWLRGRHIAQYDPEGNILLFDDPLDGLYPQQEYMWVKVNGPNPGTGEYEPPEELTHIAFPTKPEGVLPVTFGHAPPDPAGNVVLFAQADFSTGTLVPLPAPLIDSFNAFDVDVGDVWTWQVTNLTHGDHPFHTHGFTFIPYEVEFIDLDNPETDIVFKYPFKHIKDTIRVPARGGSVPGRSFAILRGNAHFHDEGREGQAAAQGQLPTFYPDGTFTSGGWLFHCHVLEHSAKGMLSFYEVHDPNDPFTLLGKHLPGTNGNVSLTAEGDLSPGSTVTFHLVDALPNAEAWLVAGLEAKRAEVAGGELVPNMGKIWVTTTDADGNATWEITEWNNAGSGKDIYWQVGIKDPGAVKGWAISNALMFTRP